MLRVMPGLYKHLKYLALPFPPLPYLPLCGGDAIFVI